MSEQQPVNVEEAFKPELRHGPEAEQRKAEWDAYLESRPFVDSQGKVRHPETGQFINTDTYFDERRQELEADGLRTKAQAYEDMSMPDLARKLAEAEHHNDRTMTGDVHKVLLGKMLEKHKRTQSSRDVRHNAQRLDNLVGRVMAIKDEKLEALQKEDSETGGGSEPEPPGPSPVFGPVDKRPERRTDGVITAPSVSDDAYPEHVPQPGPAGPKPKLDEAITQPIPTIKLPEIETEPGPGPDSSPSRWARFKKAVRRHMYEAPVKETPMGPATQPAIPFEEWYAQKHGGQEGQEEQEQGSGRLSRTADKTAEKLGEFTDFVNYMGSMALIDTVYYAGNAAAEIRGFIQDVKEATANKIKGAASDVAFYTGMSVGISAELASRAAWRIGYLGYVALGHMNALPAKLRERFSRLPEQNDGPYSDNDSDESDGGKNGKADPAWAWQEDWGWHE